MLRAVKTGKDDNAALINRSLTGGSSCFDKEQYADSNAQPLSDVCGSTSIAKRLMSRLGLEENLIKIRQAAGKSLWKKALKTRSDYVAAIILYFIHHKRFSLLVGQSTFSERIVLRNARPHPAFSTLSDKYEVREHVKEAIGPQHLIPIYQMVDDMTDFDFTSLPRAFVMKATHGSGWVKLIEDQQNESVEDLKALATSWLSKSYHLKFRESQYKAIKPRIIFEKLLLEDG
ncbi:MAG: hypothetical protein FJX25_17870, partial [Alphaproteobacteria bacterium]|nr:hypothetical protein [Alphaproteobacteria bacterium]